MGSGAQSEETEAAIDTGFTGFLTLSPALVELLQLPYWEASEFTLGDGSSVRLDVYKGRVSWDGLVREVLILEAEGTSLVGMSLLYGYRLTMDVVDGGPVTIEALI